METRTLSELLEEDVQTMQVMLKRCKRALKYLRQKRDQFYGDDDGERYAGDDSVRREAFLVAYSDAVAVVNSALHEGQE